ncbi:hypothetical protein DPX16_0502 [Anabarilius grahami]|uniref:Uncharacterized protein n=1 Tax=Anabarilius grahami TaxID=495550 RepID=A0A3N0YSW2_ANAGA|nr:hypothetical protein DPX16_0502 [Anabarilius grahami]
MDPAIRLIRLRQGNCTLEDHIQKFLDIAYYADWPDCALIDFSCDGINQPLQSELRREGPRSSLTCFLDYALLTVGSPFTVGVAEKCDTSLNQVMAAVPKDIHKMAATIITTPSQVSADLPEPRQVTVDLHEPSQVTVDLCEPSQVQVKLPESRHVPADRPESRHVSGSFWERRGLRSSVADPPLTSARAAGIPKPQPAASLSSPPAASHSGQPPASHSSSPVATHSSSPVATHCSSAVSTDLCYAFKFASCYRLMFAGYNALKFAGCRALKLAGCYALRLSGCDGQDGHPFGVCKHRARSSQCVRSRARSSQ